MDVIKTVQAELNSNTAERNVLEALTKNISPTADREYKLSKEVLEYSEEMKVLIRPRLFLQNEGWLQFRMGRNSYETHSIIFR